MVEISEESPEFWRETWPVRVREAARPILLATGIFWASSIVGFLLTARNPVLEGFFVSPAMRAAIESKRLWTEPLTRTAPAASSAIAVNNINVSLLTWGLGLTFGIGTVSPSNIPGVAKALLGLSLAVALLGYIVARGHPGMSPLETTSGDR